MKSNKKRLDVLVSEQNPEMTRSRAQSEIMSGCVYVNGQKELKPGTMFPENTIVQIRGQGIKYVSRGGLKLEKAMECFPIDLKNKICMDIGASTGGFTDCMLQNGAKKVYCIDVGKGLLHYKLRQDPRVVVMEKTNVRYLKPDEIPERPDFASIDVSFISLTLVISPVLEILNEDKKIIMLIKPQFEAGKEKVGKKGVVRDARVHNEVIEKIYDFITGRGLIVAGLDYSPVKGPEGNIEYLMYICSKEKTEKGLFVDKEDISRIVQAAHDELDK